VDLITAATISPTLRFISSALLRVITLFNEIVSNLNDNVSHYSTELKFRYFARQRIACG
jgi:hypothetical protein